MAELSRQALIEELHQRVALWDAPRAKRLRKLPVRMLLPRLLAAVRGNWRVTARTFFGADISVHLPDLAGTRLYRYGFIEEGLTRAVIEHLQPGDVFIDIGAHAGYYTVLASRLVGPRGQAIAFEPTPRTRRDLSSNIVNLGNAKIVPKAAWDSPSRLTLRDFGWQSSSFNSVVAPRLPKALPYQVIEVEAIAVDDWLNAHGVVPQFIKIDAESAEHRVLKGLARTIERYHPILSVEIGDFDLPGVPSSPDLIRSLLAQGYDAWEYRGGRFELHSIADRYAYDNLLFMPRDRTKK